MQPFKTLLIGLGQIGCGYDAHIPFNWNEPQSSSCILSHARAVACHPSFDLLGGIDPSPIARDKFLQLYEKPTYPDLKTWRESISYIKPELVIIAVSPILQPAIVDKLLSLVSPRMLLLEKPVATDIQQALGLETLCSAHTELAVAVNYIRRYLPAVQQWKTRLHSGELGELLYGCLTYGKGLLTNGSHFVNLAEFWLGPLRMESLFSEGSACLGYDRESSLNLNVINHPKAILQIRSIGDYMLRAGELDLWFTNGRLCWRNDGKSIDYWPRCPSNNDYDSYALEPDITPTKMERYQFLVIDSLANYLHFKVNALHCSLDDGISTLKTLGSCF